MLLQRIDTANGTLAVDVEGSGPLIICAHGMGDSRASYAPFAKKLVAAGYTVANMDVRGHGDSSTTFLQYGDEATAEDYLTVIKHFNQGPAVLAGSSFSSGSATMAAGKAPEMVAGLILNAPFLRNPPGLAGKIGGMLMPVLFMRPWGPSVWESYAATLWPGLGKEGTAAHAAETRRVMTQPGRWAAFQKTVAGLDHGVVAPWISKASKTPALVVMGKLDPDWSDPAAEADWVASQFRDSTKVLLEGVGQAPMYERVDEVSAAAVDFLGKLREKGAFGRQ